MESRKVNLKRYLKLAFLSALIIGVVVTTYVVLRGQFEARRKADTSRVAEFFLVPNTVEVEPNATFDVTVWLNTHGRDVVGVDVLFHQSSLLEIVDIEPDYTYFPTFVPVDREGSFDVSTAVSQNSFGAVTFNWNNETEPISPPVNGASVRLANVTFKALFKGETVIWIKYEGDSTTDSNVTMIEETTDVVADILTITDNSRVLVKVGMQQACVDNDSDGYSFYDATSCTDGTDCNDNNSEIYPDALEKCNNVDDNCNSYIDEDVFRSCLGPDSCDGIQSCVDGQWGDCDCNCIPDCTGKQCGSDGCGGSCGSCEATQLCRFDKCLTSGYLLVTADECTEGDWRYSDGACQVDNTLERTWVKTRECEGGIEHPTTESVSCIYDEEQRETEQEVTTTEGEEEGVEEEGVLDVITSNMKKPLKQIPFIGDVIGDEETNDIVVFLAWGIAGVILISGIFLTKRILKKRAEKKGASTGIDT